MSSSYSANQFEGVFKAQRLQNWCESKPFKQRPTAQEGHTTFVADDRGHLLPGVVKRRSAWSDFKGTWDLPARIPARRINPTGRSEEGLSRLRTWGFDPQHTRTSGTPWTPAGSRNSDKDQIHDTSQKDGAVSPCSASKALPAIQDRPVSGIQEQGIQTAVGPGSAASPRASSRAHSGTGGAGSDEALKVVPTRSPTTSKQSQRDA
ncbi:protein Flattop [Halichoeres trimaculatus]|uniref:protein Flattop n=1 Tax=Halichoeres trimaculatus TaxID=147232 RepID=UPI003D9DCCFB